MRPIYVKYPEEGVSSEVVLANERRVKRLLSIMFKPTDSEFTFTNYIEGRIKGSRGPYTASRPEVPHP